MPTNKKLSELTPQALASDTQFYVQRSGVEGSTTLDDIADGHGHDLDAITETASKKVMTSAERTKLAGIESGATADMTNSEIKTAYENNADTNAFTDADKSKLDGIESGAQVNASSRLAEATVVWGNIDGSPTGSLTLENAYNVASVVKSVGAGPSSYGDVTFSNPLGSANYMVLFELLAPSSGSYDNYGLMPTIYGTKTVNTFTFSILQRYLSISAQSADYRIKFIIIDTSLI